MKKTFLTTFLSIVFAMVAVACHGSDEKEIGYTELPVQAQQFVKQYFPSATYSRIEKEKDHGQWEYEATLSDGTKIDFNDKGEWESVDCKFSALPSGIIPDVIAADILSKSPILLEKAGWGISFIPIQRWQEHQGCGICFLQHQN